LRIDPQLVTPSAQLSELGAESLDLLEITMEAEDEFAIVMPQKDILRVAQDVFGPGVLVNEGRLTEAGARFLQRRLPERGSGAITTGMAVADVTRVFQRVSMWVWVIQGLLEQSPQACGACGASLGKPIAGRRKCTSCATEVDLPAGDDLNQRWVEEYQRAEQQLPSDGGVQFA
jgi:acyl carrier protein